MNRRERATALRIDRIEAEQRRTERGIDRAEALLNECIRRAYAAHIAVSLSGVRRETVGVR